MGVGYQGRMRLMVRLGVTCSDPLDDRSRDTDLRSRFPPDGPNDACNLRSKKRATFPTPDQDVNVMLSSQQRARAYGARRL